MKTTYNNREYIVNYTYDPAVVGNWHDEPPRPESVELNSVMILHDGKTHDLDMEHLEKLRPDFYDFLIQECLDNERTEYEMMVEAKIEQMRDERLGL